MRHQGCAPGVLAGDSAGPGHCPLKPRIPPFSSGPRSSPPLLPLSSAPRFSPPLLPLSSAPFPSSTFALPVGMRSKANVAAVLAVELGHEGLVGVTDEQDGRIEGLDLLLAALVCLDADGPPAAPVVPLTFKPFPQPGVRNGTDELGEASPPLRPLLGLSRESLYINTHIYLRVY